MPIDTSIYRLADLAQPYSPLDSAARAMSLRNAVLGNQAAQLEIDARTREAAKAKADADRRTAIDLTVGKYVRDGKIDYAGAQAELGSMGQGQAALDLETKRLADLKAEREAREAELKAQLQQQQVYMQKAQLLGQIAATAKSPRQASFAIEKALEAGLINEQQAEELHAMPWNDETASQFQQMAMLGISTEKQHAIKLAELEEERKRLMFAPQLAKAENEAITSKPNEQGLTPAQVAQQQTAEAERALRVSEGEKNRAVTLRGQNMADARSKEAAEKPMSAEGAKVLAIAETIVPELEQLKAAIAANPRTAIAGILSKTDPHLSRLAENAADKVGRLRSGGAVNPNEETRFMGQIARKMDIVTGDASAALSAIDGVINEANQVVTSMKPKKGKPQGQPDKKKDPLGIL